MDPISENLAVMGLAYLFYAKLNLRALVYSEDAPIGLKLEEIALEQRLVICLSIYKD